MNTLGERAIKQVGIQELVRVGPVQEQRAAYLRVRDERRGLVLRFQP
jgi:hypothetical protein